MFSFIKRYMSRCYVCIIDAFGMWKRAHNPLYHYCWLQDVVLDLDFFLSNPFSLDNPLAPTRVLLPFVMGVALPLTSLALGFLDKVSAWTRLSLCAAYSSSSSSSRPSNSFLAMGAFCPNSWSVWDLWVRRLIGWRVFAFWVTDDGVEGSAVLALADGVDAVTA